MGIIYSYIFGTEQPSADVNDGQQAKDSRQQDSPVNDHPCIQHENNTVDAPRTETSLPSFLIPDHIDEVDKKNIYVNFSGKSKEFFLFPTEKFCVLLQEACDWTGKKPHRMNLVFEGDILDVKKTMRDYPRLRGGSKVFLISSS